MKKIKKSLAVVFLSTSLFITNTYANNEVKVDVYEVQKPKDINIKLTYPATITAYKKVQVIARVLGTLKQKSFVEGQKVNKGDILYQIEDDIYLAKVNEAKASLKMSEATFNNAKRSWARVKKLFSQKAVSKKTRDNSFAAYEQALASVALSKAKLSQAKIELNYTKVKAPISGVTSLKKVDLGALVRANDTNLVQITQTDKLYALFSIPLSDYKNLKTDKWSTKNAEKIKLTIKIADKKIPAVVDYTDINIDAKTSVVNLRAIINNKENILMPGQFVRVELNNIIQKNTIQIPQKALLQNPKGTVVFVVENNIAKIKPVVIDSTKDENFIIKKGFLHANDKVIVNNFFRVQPGNKVSIDKTINKEE